jgi:hypothetical protein
MFIGVFGIVPTAPKIKLKLSAIGAAAALHFITVFVHEGHGDEAHNVTTSTFKSSRESSCQLLLIGTDRGWMHSFTINVPRLYDAWKMYNTRHYSSVREQIRELLGVRATDWNALVLRQVVLKWQIFAVPLWKR